MAYATREQLANYLHSDAALLPEDVERLLDRASELVDYVTLNKSTLVRDDDTATLDVLNKATCAQVEQWLETGESDVSGEAVSSYSIGKLSINYDKSDRDISERAVSRRTKRILMISGLLYRGINSV